MSADDPTQFRYVEQLTSQLRCTLSHLTALLTPDDLLHLREHARFSDSHTSSSAVMALLAWATADFNPDSSESENGIENYHSDSIARQDLDANPSQDVAAGARSIDASILLTPQQIRAGSEPLYSANSSTPVLLRGGVSATTLARAILAAGEGSTLPAAVGLVARGTGYDAAVAATSPAMHEGSPSCFRQV